jgi:hypothetical protein
MRWKPKQTCLHFRSATNFIPLFISDIFLAHLEVRKFEFNNNSIYDGFNGIITLTFKMPDSKSWSCLWYNICHTLHKNTAVLSVMSSNLFKKLISIALNVANVMRDFRARLVKKNRRSSFKTKILSNCLDEAQFYTFS